MRVNKEEVDDISYQDELMINVKAKCEAKLLECDGFCSWGIMVYS